MEWEDVKAELEQILNAPVALEMLDSAKYTHASLKESGIHDALSAVIDHKVYFKLSQCDKMLRVFSIEEVLITSSERKLTEKWLGACAKRLSMNHTQHSDSKAESMNGLREWLLLQIKEGKYDEEPPEILATTLNMAQFKVPFLLYGHHTGTDESAHQEISTLLSSFFGEEVLVIPLQENEWLVLAKEEVLVSDSGEADGQEETIEQLLSSAVEGLYEMLVTEWVGDCELTVDYPGAANRQLMQMIKRLRETQRIGKQFQMNRNIYMPWELRLERLLFQVPAAEQQNLVSHVFRQEPDAETLSTLTHFFELDCNVSETAKMMYIHRNTLLYRLDKFKHETGYDVRKFDDAVLVNIAMLLYKVTKGD